MSQKLRLDRDYYKGNTRRDINGYNTQTGWWFTGGTSFMSNGYVIYTNGLDGNPPNPTALAQGRTYESRLFDERSMNPRSSYYQFTSQLKAIADRAAANEERYLTLKLQQLKTNSTIDVDYLDKIQQAIESKDYNAAYTLLLRRDKDLDKFRDELNSNRNKMVGRTNEFFKSQFYAFLAQKFEQQLSTQTGAFRTVTLEDSFEDLVNEFLSIVFNISVDQNESLRAIRDDFVNDLEDIAKTSGGRVRISTMLKDGKTLYDTVKGSKKVTKKDGQEVAKTIKAKQSLVTKKGQYRSVGVLANAFAKSLQLYVGNGLSQEIHNIAAGTEIGSHVQSTGGIKKEVTTYLGDKRSVVSQKDDVIIRDVFNAVVPIDQLIQSVYDDGFKDQTQAFHEEVTRRMKQQAEVYDTSEFFEIAVNVKGYTSLHDLQIEGAGSFSAKMGTLSQIQLDGNMVNKLIFMLNNTTNGCIMAGRQSEIEDYLASVCVVWMWDNPQEIFDLDMKGPSNYKKIYLFNSGGSYFTASQILYQTLERLVNFEDNSNKFVKVGIQPAPAYSGYDKLVKQYSVNEITAKDEWQAMLQKRWDAVKEETMHKGTLSIHFDQRDLEELIGNLRNILNS